MSAFPASRAAPEATIAQGCGRANGRFDRDLNPVHGRDAPPRRSREGRRDGPSRNWGALGMKILSILAGYSSGGAETLARNLAKEFVPRGHRCHVAVVSNAVDIGNCPDFQASFERDLKAYGITHEVIGDAARRNPLLGGARLRRIVRRFRPDVIHAHTGHGLMFQALSLIRVPTVYTHHNIRMNFPPALFWLFDRFVDRYVAICGACEMVLHQHVRRPVALIYNGVPASFASDEVRHAPARHPVVLAVGALTPQKDYPTLVRAAALVVPLFAQQGRRISFRIAGSGPAEAEMRRTVAETGMEERVGLLGTRTDISRLMAEADLLANASLYEGFPIALIEAAMSSLPVVATDVGGNGEIVIDGESGRLVPPRRPDLLAEGIVELCSDAETYAAFSARARAASQRFTIERCADEYLRLYEEIAWRPAS
jgi:glycosyltransferase involved in cell wall biosynthesis